MTDCLMGNILTQIPKDKRIKADIKRLQGFTSEKDKIKFIQAANDMCYAVNSLKFKDWCCGYRFTNTLKTGMQVYDHIMSGDDLFGEADKDIDIDVTLYYKRFTSVIGYGLPNTLRTWLNKKFFFSMSKQELAGHIFHESLHKFGYNHISAKEYTSVPYACGNKVRDILKAVC